MQRKEQKLLTSCPSWLGRSKATNRVVPASRNWTESAVVRALGYRVYEYYVWIATGTTTSWWHYLVIIAIFIEESVTAWVLCQ
eukprot:6187653-Pleurochrysis_carterae.AAC.5